jgi:hypothetical protein
MYSYKVRPEYGKENLLIEFVNGTENENFLQDLFGVLAPLNFKTLETMDAWMNDEVWLTISSSVGKFTLTKDIWDFVFILADEKNQSGLKAVEEHLATSGKFHKMDVDFSQYR